MRYFVENLYKSNLFPLDDNIKFIIYTQYYKNCSKISEDLKKDIHTYGMINYVIEPYKKNFNIEEYNREYFLYDLYNDLVHQHHVNDCKNYINHDAILANHYINTVVMETFHNRSNYIYYPFVMSRIKYFWRLLNYNQRLHFVSSMRIRFNL